MLSQKMLKYSKTIHAFQKMLINKTNVKSKILKKNFFDSLNCSPIQKSFKYRIWLVFENSLYV